MTEAPLILGIDPGLATVGYAFLNQQDDEYHIVDYGVISTIPGTPFHERLVQLKEDLTILVRKYKPARSYVEELFFGTNAKTALQVAQARGVLVSTLSEMGLEPISITPNQVKQGLTGDGNADKLQVQEMLKLQFSLDDLPTPDDAADAIAIAYCGAIRHQRSLT